MVDNQHHFVVVKASVIMDRFALTDWEWDHAKCAAIREAMPLPPSQKKVKVSDTTDATRACKGGRGSGGRRAAPRASARPRKVRGAVEPAPPTPAAAAPLTPQTTPTLALAPVGDETLVTVLSDGEAPIIPFEPHAAPHAMPVPPVGEGSDDSQRPAPRDGKRRRTDAVAPAGDAPAVPVEEAGAVSCAEVPYEPPAPLQAPTPPALVPLLEDPATLRRYMVPGSVWYSVRLDDVLHDAVPSAPVGETIEDALAVAIDDARACTPAPLSAIPAPPTLTEPAAPPPSVPLSEVGIAVRKHKRHRLPSVSLSEVGAPAPIVLSSAPLSHLSKPSGGGAIVGSASASSAGASASAEQLVLLRTAAAVAGLEQLRSIQASEMPAQVEGVTMEHRVAVHAVGDGSLTKRFFIKCPRHEQCTLSRSAHDSQLAPHGFMGIWGYFGAWLTKECEPDTKATHKQFYPTVPDQAAYLTRKGYMHDPA